MNALIPGETTLLRALQPIQWALDAPGTREIVINKPFRYGVENGEGWTWHDDERLSFRWLEAASRLAARRTGNDLSRGRPWCSTKLPSGARATIVIPGALPEGMISWTIRKRAVDFTPTIPWLEECGWFRFLPQTGPQARDWPRWLQRQVEAGATIAFTGRPGSSKTTALEACVRGVPLDERILSLESVPELFDLPHENWVPMVYAQEAGQGLPTAAQALETSLRQRGDRVIFGELRTAEAWGLLRVLMSGQRGTMMTAHCDPGMDAFVDTVHLMVQQAPDATGVPMETVKALIRKHVDIVIACERVKDNNEGVPYRAVHVDIAREMA